MDWTKVQAGDPIEPAVVAWREWRYRLGPPLRLLSMSFPLEWSPDHPMENNPDARRGGLHGLINRPEVWAWSSIESAGPQDGFVLGQAVFWGICLNCEHGYRAQFARPVKFIEARGRDADVALERLRRMWGVP